MNLPPISNGLKVLAAFPPDRLAATTRRIVAEAGAIGAASNGDSATTPTITEKDGGGNIPHFSPKSMGQLIEEYKNGDGLDPDWIWEGYLPAGGLAMLAGTPKAGKTTFAAHLAAAVEEGRDFLGFATKQTHVLWLGLEERGQDVARRFDTLAVTTIIYQPGPFRVPEDYLPELAAWIKGRGVGLVVVDTLSKFWDVNDENDAAGTDRAMDMILRLARDSGAAILLLHHTKKTEGEGINAIRGSSALAGNLDVGIVLKCIGGDGSSRRVLNSFSRFSETPVHLEAELRDEGFWVRLEHTASKTPTNKHDATLKAALSPEPEDVPTIAKRAGVSESTVRRRLRHLATAEPSAVRKSGGGERGDAEKFCMPTQNGARMPPPPTQTLGGAMAAETPALFADDTEIEARVEALPKPERDRYFTIFDRLDGPTGDPATIKQQAWAEFISHE